MLTSIDDLGLLKMDFLGLRNLDVIDKAVDLVGGVDIGALTLDDAKTYEMLARATRAVSSSSSRRGCATRSGR